MVNRYFFIILCSVVCMQISMPVAATMPGMRSGGVIGVSSMSTMPMGPSMGATSIGMSGMSSFGGMSGFGGMSSLSTPFQMMLQQHLGSLLQNEKSKIEQAAASIQHTRLQPSGMQYEQNLQQAGVKLIKDVAKTTKENFDLLQTLIVAGSIGRAQSRAEANALVENFRTEYVAKIESMYEQVAQYVKSKMRVACDQVESMLQSAGQPGQSSFGMAGMSSGMMGMSGHTMAGAGGMMGQPGMGMSSMGMPGMHGMKDMVTTPQDALEYLRKKLLKKAKKFIQEFENGMLRVKNQLMQLYAQALATRNPQSPQFVALQKQLRDFKQQLSSFMYLTVSGVFDDFANHLAMAASNTLNEVEELARRQFFTEPGMGAGTPMGSSMGLGYSSMGAPATGMSPSMTAGMMSSVSGMSGVGMSPMGGSITQGSVVMPGTPVAGV